MSLQGASVLVTGGTRGIGRAIALRLVSDGAARAVLGYMRNDKAAEEAAALVEEAGAELVGEVRRRRADEGVDVVAGRLTLHRRKPSACR